MLKWRWDQGRLLYFEYDVIRLMAKQLQAFDGRDIGKLETLFRSALMNGTGMPFAPSSYTVKRNYSRVFQCTFLAGFAGDMLVTTDFCKELAKEDGAFQTPDDYFINYVNRFRFPFPAFQDYNTVEERVYPFCAIIKRLLALADVSVTEACMDVDDVFRFVIANRCTGLEDIDFYRRLLPQDCDCTNDEKRQVREMMVFVSQLSFLKVHNHCLYLDAATADERRRVLSYLRPVVTLPLENRFDEFFSMTGIDKSDIVIPKFEELPLVDYSGIEIQEGNRKRTEHFRIERSPLLKRYYKQAYPEPVCRACGKNMQSVYPWTGYMLDVHHLLPLSMGIRINTRGTSLDDLVGLCPSCHRAVHLFYNKWLTAHGRKDFESRIEAMDVYLEAVREITIWH